MGKTRRYLAGLVCLACLIAFTVSVPVAAQMSSMSLYNGGYLGLWTPGNYSNYSPDIAYDSLHDEFLVVWENIQPGGTHDVYARRVSGNGDILTWFAVSAGPNNRVNPSVAYDSIHDRYLVTWAYDSSGDGSDMDIYGRYISWDGGSMQPEFGISTSRANELKPKVVYGQASDRFLVVWMEGSTGSASSIAGSFILNNVTFLAVPISSGTEDRDFPDVTYNLARDQYLVTWDVIKSGSGSDIYALRLDAVGNVLTPEFAVANTSLIEQHPSVAACRQADQYLVVWQQEYSPGADYDIWGRFMTGDISLSPVQFIEGTTGGQEFPDVTCNWAGTEYFVAWHDQYANPALRWGVWAKQIHTNHSMENAFEVVAPSASADRLYPAVAGGKSSYMAAWQHQRDGFSNFNIWGEIFFFLPPHKIFLPLIHR